MKDWRDYLDKIQDRSKRYIVCAAIRKDDTIICGPRHLDPIMWIQLKMLGYVTAGGEWEQGFITNKREFVNRKEAWIIAAKNGQIRYDIGSPEGILFSENLY